MGDRVERLLGPLVLLAGIVLIAMGDVGWGVAIALIGVVGLVMGVAGELGRRARGRPGRRP